MNGVILDEKTATQYPGNFTVSVFIHSLHYLKNDTVIFNLIKKQFI